MIGQGYAFPDLRRTPVTVVFIALAVLGFLLTFFAANLAGSLIFQGLSSPVWTWLTYPWVSGGIVGLLFTLLWASMVFSDLEASRGTPWMSVLVGVAVLVFPAVAGLYGLTGMAVVLAGETMPIAAVTMVWCALNSEAEIRIFGIIPLKGKWLAILEVVLVLFQFGAGGFGLAVALAFPLIGFWFVGKGKISLPTRAARKSRVGNETKREREFDRYRDDIYRREKEREERERLRKLFESSLSEDPDERSR